MFTKYWTLNYRELSRAKLEAKIELLNYTFCCKTTSGCVSFVRAQNMTVHLFEAVSCVIDI